MWGNSWVCATSEERHSLEARGRQAPAGGAGRTVDTEAGSAALEQASDS